MDVVFYPGLDIMTNDSKPRWSTARLSQTRCCMLSGMTAVICTYPLDVVRARLAFQVTGDHHYTGIINAFQTIYLKVVFIFSDT